MFRQTAAQLGMGAVTLHGALANGAVVAAE
jgi:hypothetical protein